MPIRDDVLKLADLEHDDQASDFVDALEPTTLVKGEGINEYAVLPGTEGTHEVISKYSPKTEIQNLRRKCHGLAVLTEKADREFEEAGNSSIDVLERASE